MKTIALVARVLMIAIIALFVFRYVASAQQPAGPVEDLTIDNAAKQLSLTLS